MASLRRLASALTLVLALSVSEGVRIRRHRHNSTGRALVLETAGRLIISEDGDENAYYLSKDVGDGDKVPKTPMFLDGGRGVKIPFDSRYYIMTKPNMRSSPNRGDFKMFSLMDKAIEYTVDLNGAGCGCNAAFYTISMPHAGPGAGNDWYCDANNVGGQACPEFDLSEMNTNAHKTVAHGCTTPWKEEHCDKWGPPASTFSGGTFQRGANIDSTKPFTVKHTFSWTQVTTTITQNGISESRTMHGLNTEMGMPHLKGRPNGMSEALRDGQVIAISFWGNEDMSWLDGCNPPNGGPGAYKGYGNPESCAPFYTVSDVKVSSNTNAPTPAPDRDLEPNPPPGESVVEKHGMLSVRGNKIVDKTGAPLRLRGMSMFWSQWMPQFWNADTVNWLKSDWHSTVVRAAMGIEHGGYLENPGVEKARLESVVDAAIAAGIYVVIDWHDHHAEEHLEQAKGFFDEMARKYGGYPNVLFEVYNEPVHQDWSDTIRPFHEAIVPVIRRHTNNIIILGTRSWSQEVDEASRNPVAGKNLAYTIHFYANTHRQSLRNKVSTALANGIAVFATEWGTCDASGDGTLDLGETQAWLDFFEQHHISDANWAVSDKSEACSALLPGASGQGGWSASQLTESGRFVRASLRGENDNIPRPEPTGGCCSFGADCGDCGEDGTGWCHESAANCEVCTGIFDTTAEAPICDGSTPAPSPPPSDSTPAPSPPPSDSCSGAYAQCGGNGWGGPTCCQQGLTCKSQNEWYSQCVP